MPATKSSSGVSEAPCIVLPSQVSTVAVSALHKGLSGVLLSPWFLPDQVSNFALCGEPTPYQEITFVKLLSLREKSTSKHWLPTPHRV